MDIVITGAVGVGKTSVCERVAGMLKDQGLSCGGIITPKAPGGGIIVVDITSGRREVLASTGDIYKGPHIGKYYFNPLGIAFGMKAIERGMCTDVLFVDEIGPLELSGGGFVRALELFGSGRARNSVVVIREELLKVFLAESKTSVSIFETTIKNRDDLPEKICTTLISVLA